MRRFPPSQTERAGFSKNPSISKVFREIGLADELGSGMRNSYKYTKLYSGAEPEFIEGDVFKIIIPLTTGAMTKVGPGIEITKAPLEGSVRKVPLESSDKKIMAKTEGQRAVILDFMSDQQWYSSSDIMPSVDIGERGLRKLLGRMIDDGLLVSKGEKRWRRYKKVLS